MKRHGQVCLAATGVGLCIENNRGEGIFMHVRQRQGIMGLICVFLKQPTLTSTLRRNGLALII